MIPVQFTVVLNSKKDRLQQLMEELAAERDKVEQLQAQVSGRGMNEGSEAEENLALATTDEEEGGEGSEAGGDLSRGGAPGEALLPAHFEPAILVRLARTF